MSFFKELSPEQRDMIISLPYRTAHWISHIDDIETSKRDDKYEAQAIDRAIRKIARQNVAGSLPREIMMQVDNNRHLWSKWQVQSTEPILFEEIEKTKTILKEKTSGKALKQYKQMLWYMALTVAHAFGEEDDPDQEMHFNNFMADIKNRFFPGGNKKNPNNISAVEKTALKKLSAALKS